MKPVEEPPTPLASTPGFYTVSRDEDGKPEVTSEVLDSLEDVEGEVEPWVVDG